MWPNFQQNCWFIFLVASKLIPVLYYFFSTPLPNSFLCRCVPDFFICFGYSGRWKNWEVLVIVQKREKVSIPWTSLNQSWVQHTYTASLKARANFHRHSFNSSLCFCSIVELLSIVTDNTCWREKVVFRFLFFCFFFSEVSVRYLMDKLKKKKKMWKKASSHGRIQVCVVSC